MDRDQLIWSFNDIIHPVSNTNHPLTILFIPLEAFWWYCATYRMSSNLNSNWVWWIWSEFDSASIKSTAKNKPYLFFYIINTLTSLLQCLICANIKFKTRVKRDHIIRNKTEYCKLYYMSFSFFLFMQINIPHFFNDLVDAKIWTKWEVYQTVTYNLVQEKMKAKMFLK